MTSIHTLPFGGLPFDDLPFAAGHNGQCRKNAAKPVSVLRLAALATSMAVHFAPALADGASGPRVVARDETSIPLKLSADLTTAMIDGASQGKPGIAGDHERVITPQRDTEQGWWATNTDCTISTAPPWDKLDLASALGHYLCKNPDLRQATATIAQNQAALGLADADRWPQWRANAEYNDYRNFNSSGLAGRTLGGSISLSWTLLDFGRRDANIRAAREALMTAEATRDSTTGDQILAFLQLYGEAVIAAAKLEASVQTRTTAAQTAEAAMARHQAQVGSRIEMLQARTAFAQARLEHVRAQASWNAARRRLALALGGKADQTLTLHGWESWVSAPLTGLPQGPALDELISTHPRMQAASANVRSAQARLDLAKASQSAQVTLSASAGKVRNWGAAGTGTYPNGSAAIVASLPLFDGQRLTAQIQQANAAVEAAQAQHEAERRAVVQTLWDTQSALNTSQEALAMSEELLGSAQATYEVAQGRYKAGVGSMTELLDAQSSLADARSQRAEILMGQVTALTSAHIASVSPRFPPSLMTLPDISPRQ